MAKTTKTQDEKKLAKYKPSKEKLARIEDVYKELDIMIEVRNEKYSDFNDRTLLQFVDDSQKRANGYVPSRESQDKEEWQANVFTKTTRNKVKGIIASVSKDVPDISISAYNAENQISNNRAEVVKDMVAASYTQGVNPEMVILKDAWDMTINGTVIVYDGYIKTKEETKTIKSYDLSEGTIEYDLSTEVVEDKPIEINVPIQNLFIKNIYIHDIQDQSALCWVDYMDYEHLEKEFGKYKDFEFIPKFSNDHSDYETQTFFMDKWKDRNRVDQYEVIRFYKKGGGGVYRIICHGVELFDGPLLWGGKKKVYPFAKQVFEFMANSNFFYGNSLPNLLMDEQDVKNALYNSFLDQEFRVVATPMLVGIINKDNFDLEDEYVDQDTNIYVEDVNQVKPLPVQGVSQGGIALLNITNKGLDENSIDAVQGGQAGSGSTAREIVISNERADEIKGLVYTMLKNLWIQKYRLRIPNLLMNMNMKKVVTITGEDGAKTIKETFKTFRNKNAKLSDGSVGTKQIEVVDSIPKGTDFNLDIREETAGLEGSKVEILQVTSHYLDEWEYEIELTTQTFHQKSRALDMAMVDEKVKGAAAFFPDIFMANKNEFFKMWMEKFGENPEEFLRNVPQAPPGMPMGPAGMAPQGGIPAVPGQAGAPALPQLSGT